MIENKKICLGCKKEFYYKFSRLRLYCSKECYLKAPKGERSQEHKDKLRDVNLEYYKITSKEILQKRWSNISKAREIHLNEEEIGKLKEYLTLGYVKDRKILIRKISKNKSPKALNNYKKYNLDEWNRLYANVFKGQLDVRVQNLTIQEFEDLKKDISTKTNLYIMNKWGIGEKTIPRIAKFWQLHKDKASRKETRLEYTVRKILEEANISYERERYINNMKFRYDFMVKGNKIIEVHGNYIHANPSLYDYSDLDSKQIRVIKQDIIKKQWYNQNGYELLEVWEKDLDENFEEIKRKIIEYAS